MSALYRPPFPAVIDSSMVAAFRGCKRKFELEYLFHWKPKSESIHLRAGKAFARGLETARKSFYVQRNSPDLAVAHGVGALWHEYGEADPGDTAKTWDRMAGALEFYYDRYPLTDDPAPPITLPSGERGIEFSFLEPLPFNHPETGDPILYSGRFDSLSDFAGGVFGVDEKTTSQLGATWPKQWDLRSQFTAYCWGALQAGFPIKGFLVRGVSILKTKYETAEAITYRPQWQVERWMKTLLNDLRSMVEMWEAGYFDYNLDETCNHYGGCMFRQVCLSEEPEPWLETGFERRRWDPVTRIEEVVE